MSVMLSGCPAVSRAEVEDALTDFFRHQLERATRYGPEFERLWQLAGEGSLGGKLVRPMLFIDMHEALSSGIGGSLRGQCVLEVAVGLELLHLSFLLHDDVIDGDTIRRGRPNLVGSMLQDPGVGGGVRRSVEHWARSNGILMGDLLLAAAHQTFARADVPHPFRLRLLDLLEHAVSESVVGEQADVGLGDGVILPTLPAILAMTARKTATYTFELPLCAAAVLAGADHETERRLAIVGRHLGLGFQLQDDLLSAFGEPTCHGKDRFSDLREGKQTAIISYARQTDSWPQIEDLLGCADPSEFELERLSGLLRACGAERFVAGLIEDQLRTAQDLITAADSRLPGAGRRVLLSWVSELRGRRS